MELNLRRGGGGSMKMLSIQWLRFAACFGVVIFHASSHYGVPFDVGQAGVDIFFVISGLIMWTITERPVGAGQFLTQRLVRIAPMYWMVTGLIAVAALVHLFPRLYLTWPHLIASMLFVPWRSPSNGQLWPVLVPGWTLNYEIMFYILVASTLHLHRQLQFLTLIGILFSAVLAGHYLPPSSNVLNFYTNPIVLEFGFGLVIGWLKAQDLLPNFRSSVIIAILGLAFFACEAIFRLTSGIGLGRPLLFGIPSSMLVMGLVGIEKAGII